MAHLKSRSPRIDRGLKGFRGLFTIAVLGGLFGCGEPTEPPRKTNLLLVVVDTLRADHLGIYGYERETSPRIDALARSGVRFEDAVPPWPKTLPSMASMLTGTYPLTTGVRLDHMVRMRADQPTLAENLREHGYQTGAVVANFNTGKFFTFDRGFDEFVESWMEEVFRETGRRSFTNAPGKVKRYTNATVVTDQALRLLEDFSSDSPFFLWLQYMDPHGPYTPPPDYSESFRDDGETRPVPVEEIPAYQRLRKADGGVIDDLSVYVRQYDRSIRYFDDEFSRLLDTLEERGMLEDTLIVLTSDHGESLTENSYYLEHGAAPYQSTAHVPLVFAMPGFVPAGKLIREPVGLIDLVPTVMDLLGLELPMGLQGRSLAQAILESGEVSPRVFMESGESERAQRVVRKGKWKLVHLRTESDRRRFGKKEFELYDLSSDPGESVDVSAENEEVFKELLEGLVDWARKTPRRSGVGIPSMDEDTREGLRQLGYLKD